ncbi:hypothetical protein FAUST_6250 [Fusarium austroamericanum]|uniref:Uncharacterized protein n=1 Tax=Fusarium austroamericanum TaxID=282268 RepID=A0AAN6BZC5_FUSAU|nr:hypothetical protein FAUST_6250 [Fusarium austroamericanum]
MNTVFDWGIDTHNEPHYGLYWGDIPKGLHQWNWPIFSNTLYNIWVMNEPLISPSSCENDAIADSMLNNEGLHSTPLSGSLPSTHGLEEYLQPESRTQQACLYEDANLDILQDDHESSSAATDLIPNSNLHEAEVALATGVEFSASIKPGTNTATKAAGKRGSRGKPSDNELRETAYQLKLQLLRHGDCDCALIQRYIASEMVNSVENLILKHSPFSSPNCTTIGSTAVSASSPTRGLGGNNGWDR